MFNLEDAKNGDLVKWEGVNGTHCCEVKETFTEDGEPIKIVVSGEGRHIPVEHLCATGKLLKLNGV